MLTVIDDEDDYDIDVDICLSCGKYHGIHAGYKKWNLNNDTVAPQLCFKCWKEQGYSYIGDDDLEE